jgi:hypothetical protein
MSHIDCISKFGLLASGAAKIAARVDFNLGQQIQPVSSQNLQVFFADLSARTIGFGILLGQMSVNNAMTA